MHRSLTWPTEPLATGVHLVYFSYKAILHGEPAVTLPEISRNPSRATFGVPPLLHLYTCHVCDLGSAPDGESSSKVMPHEISPHLLLSTCIADGHV